MLLISGFLLRKCPKTFGDYPRVSFSHKHEGSYTHQNAICLFFFLFKQLCSNKNNSKIYKTFERRTCSQFIPSKEDVTEYVLTSFVFFSTLCPYPIFYRWYPSDDVNWCRLTVNQHEINFYLRKVSFLNTFSSYFQLRRVSFPYIDWWTPEKSADSRDSSCFPEPRIMARKTSYSPCHVFLQPRSQGL